MRCMLCNTRPGIIASKRGRVFACPECCQPGGDAFELVAEGAEKAPGAKPMVVPGAPRGGDVAKLSLTDAARRARQKVKGTGRSLSGAALSLSLAACASNQESATVAQEAAARRAPRAMRSPTARAAQIVKRLGMGNRS